MWSRGIRRSHTYVTFSVFYHFDWSPVWERYILLENPTWIRLVCGGSKVIAKDWHYHSQGIVKTKTCKICIKQQAYIYKLVTCSCLSDAMEKTHRYTATSANTRSMEYQKFPYSNTQALAATGDSMNEYLALAGGRMSFWLYYVIIIHVNAVGKDSYTRLSVLKIWLF